MPRHPNSLHMTMKTSWYLSLLLLIGGLTSVSVRAATLLASDNFTLSSGTNVGTVNNTESAGVGTYTVIQPAGTTNGMSVTTLSGFGSGNVLSLANNTYTYYRAFDGGSTLTLNSLLANQTLKFTFNIRFDGGFNGADNFSFGFVNNTTSLNSIFYANLDLSATGGTTSEFKYRTGSANMSDAGTTISPNGTWTEASATSTTSYTMELAVTKLSSGSFLLEYYRNGTLYGNSTVAGSNSLLTSEGSVAITGIAFRHSQTPGLVTYLDDVSVQVVPEPSAAFLMLGAIVGFVFISPRFRRSLTHR